MSPYFFHLLSFSFSQSCEIERHTPTPHEEDFSPLKPLFFTFCQKTQRPTVEGIVLAESAPRKNNAPSKKSRIIANAKASKKSRAG
jgi:hypothetical protein